MKNATCVGACEGSKGSCSVANFGTVSEVLIGLAVTAVALVLVDALFVSRCVWTWKQTK
jgi:ABC-type long-subunit fatty acid transport system fused permease/ATPase subunit